MKAPVFMMMVFVLNNFLSSVLCEEAEALPRLVDADHREGAESLHHGGALAWDLDNQHTWCQNYKS